MKITASGGTDVATLVVFWPENLPHDTQKRLEDDWLGFIEQMRTEGKLISFPCDSDGEYLVSIFVHIPIPDDLLALCIGEEKYPTLIVQGAGYFDGGEYLFGNAQERPKGITANVSIPPGTYTATVYQVDYAEDFHDEWLLTHAGPTAMSVWNFQDFISLCAQGERIKSCRLARRLSEHRQSCGDFLGASEFSQRAGDGRPRSGVVSARKNCSHSDPDSGRTPFYAST